MKYSFALLLALLSCQYIHAQEGVFKRFALPDSSLWFTSIVQGSDKDLYIAADIDNYINWPGVPIHGYLSIGSALLRLDTEGELDYFKKYPKVGLYTYGFGVTHAVHFRSPEEILFPIRVQYGILPCGGGLALETERIGYQKIAAKDGKLLGTYIHNANGLCEISDFIKTDMRDGRLKMLYNDGWFNYVKVTEVDDQDSMYQIAESEPMAHGTQTSILTYYAGDFYDNDYIYSFWQSGFDSTFISRATNSDTVLWTSAITEAGTPLALFAVEVKNKIIVFMDSHTPDFSSEYSLRIEVDANGKLLSVQQYPQRLRKVAQVGDDSFLCIWYDPDVPDNVFRNVYIGYINSQGELVSQRQIEELDQFDYPSSIAFIPPDKYAVCGSRYKRVDLTVTEAPSSWVWIDDMANFITGVTEETLQKNKISVYPNPVQDKLHIADQQANIFREARIYTLDGKLAAQQVLANATGLDVSGISTGTYFLELIGSQGSYVQKFVKLGE